MVKSTKKDVMTEEVVVEEESGVVEIQEAAEVESGVETQEAAEPVQEPNENKDWAKARETMKEQADANKALKAELEQFRASQPKKEEPSPFAGRDKDDIITVGEVEAVFSAKERQWQTEMAEVSTKSRYPDMDDVIEKYGKTLPESVKMAVLRSENPHLAAYEACKSSADYYKDTLSSQQSSKAKRAKENLKKPGSASSVGNAGALSKAGFYEGMDESAILAESDRYILG